MLWDLVFEPDREEHIARHGVTIDEVYEVLDGSPIVRRAREGRFLVIGQSDAGRYLAVVVAPRGGGLFALVTAREADQAERRMYRRQKSS